MFFWSAYPFVRITIAFAFGIAASVFLPAYQNLIFLLLLLSLLFLTSSYLFKKEWFLNANWIFGLILVLLSFTLGYARLVFAQQDVKHVFFAEDSKVLAYRAIVATQSIQKGKYFRSTVRINSVLDSIWKPTSYKINLYVKSGFQPFNYGDEILIKGTPKQLKDPKNPDEFNYKRYLTFLTVYQQHFTDSSKTKVLSSGNGNVLITKSLALRNRFSALLEKHINEPNELAIAKALLLGNKDELTDEVKTVYAASGAMHVLAVSGLHVGIIYFVILFVLKLVPNQYRKEWLVAVIAIPLLWSYAFITGLSPSVLRAVTLFSIIAIGNSMNRRSSMVNMLAVSAFILLIFNPYLLMQVGFQLSYIAVLGIIFIYPQIRKLLMPSRRIWIFFWDVTSISIAAQLATFPLSILYFHRFPPYFLVSNMIVIPAATLIVCVGIAFFSVSWISTTLAGLLGAFLAIIIKTVNVVLAFIYHLPGSDLNNIYLNVSQTWALYFLIGFLFLFIVYKNKEWAKMASISMVVLSLLIGYRWVNNNHLKQIAVYNIPYHLSIDLIQSGNAISLMDSLLMTKSNKIHFHISPNRLLKGVNSYQDSLQHTWKQLPYGKALVWNSVSILMLDDKTDEKDYPFDMILSNLDGEKVKIVEKKEEERSLKLYDFKKNGALIINVETP